MFGMHENMWQFIGSPECAKCSAIELLRHPHHFSEALTKKTDLIEQAGLGATSLLPDVYLLRDLVRDVIAHRYKKLSFLAFAHVCVALDYFLTVEDACHDHGPDGLFDDIQVINRTKERFKDEIEAYLKWRKNDFI